MLKYWLFIIGTIIIILTTFVFGHYVPKINSEIQELDNKFGDIERKISEHMNQVRDFQMEESKGLGLRNTLAILEGMNQKESLTHKNISRDLSIIKVNALIYLATASGLNVTNELTSEWKNMSFDAQEVEKIRYAKRMQQYFESIIREKQTIENAKQRKHQLLMKMSFYGSTAQVVALLMLGLGEFLFKLKA